MSDQPAIPPTGPRDRQRDEQPSWRREFPYQHEADEVVTRRHFLQVAVVTSGALFAGTVGFAFLGRVDERRRGSPKPIAKVDDIPVGGAHYFDYPGDGDQAVLLHPSEDEFVAFSQKCTHLACSVYYQAEQDRLFCPCHDGVFEPRGGEPIAGPPQRRLPRISLEVRDGVLYALEEVP